MEEKKLKRKYADNRKIDEILERNFINISVNTKRFKGNISLMEILKVTKECIIEKGEPDERCILGNGIKWLEIYPEDGNYSILTIYNNKNEIIEWYIDIADKTGLEDGVPYEDDLYLDVIILPNGRVFLLDQEELEDAYKNNLITKKQYDLSYKTANEILKNGKSRISDLKAFCDKYLKIIESQKS